MLKRTPMGKRIVFKIMPTNDTNSKAYNFSIRFLCRAVSFVIASFLIWEATTVSAQQKLNTSRARDWGVESGILPPGKKNGITDVKGVQVGHRTLMEGKSIRTGVTVILPHGANLFQQKVPAAISVGNGFGKLAGSTQVEELGKIETPIALTNTLSVAAVTEGLVRHSISQPANRNVRSVNAIVGETNDGYLNDIRGLHVRPEHLLEAIKNASTKPAAEGNVGAGTGTRCFGFKGGIGTSSRVLPRQLGGYTVGVLVQTNLVAFCESMELPWVENWDVSPFNTLLKAMETDPA